MLKSHKDLKVWQKSYELCLDLIEKGELGILKEDIAEIENMLKAQKSL